MADNSKDPANIAQYTLHEAREKFEEYMDECIKLRTERLGKHRGQQVKRFVKFLAEKTTWYTAPCSTKYHLCVPGGLLIHSVSVCDYAIRLRNLLMPEIPLDSAIFCSMFHDVGKVYASVGTEGNLNSRYKGNILADGRMSDKVPFKYNSADDNGITLTIKDMYLPVKFVDLSDAEMQALMGADGQYVPCNKPMQHKEAPLTCIVHWSDYWNGHVLEGGLDQYYLGGILGYDD